MKRTATALAALALALGPGVSAQADQRESFTIVPSPFTEANACTGEEQTVQMTIHVELHRHDGRTVASSDIKIETSLGWSGQGHRTFRVNGQNVNGNARYMVNGPDGGKYRVLTRFKLDRNSGEATHDRLQIDCLGS